MPAINGGTLYTPYIVKSINEPETNSVIVNNSEKIVRKVISDETSAKVRYALENVVANGSGRNAYIPDYRVGGKTGTAQKVKDGRYMVGNYITSFIGFLPSDDPKVIVYVAIDNAKGVTQYGSTVAAPVAKNILTSSITALNIEKRTNDIEKKYNYGDKRYEVVPSVIGKTKKEAVSELKKFKIEFTGSGDVITYQSPSSGVTLTEGSTIRLMLGSEQ